MDQIKTITETDDDGKLVTFAGYVDSAGNRIAAMTPDEAIEFLMDDTTFGCLSPEARGVIYLIMHLRQAGQEVIKDSDVMNGLLDIDGKVTTTKTSIENLGKLVFPGGMELALMDL
jgi:hypothetical protein